MFIQNYLKGDMMMKNKDPLLTFNLTNDVYDMDEFVLIMDDQIKVEVKVSELKKILSNYLEEIKKDTYKGENE